MKLYAFEIAYGFVIMISFLPQWLENPGWALAFSKSLFLASPFPASVLQFSVLKTLSFSKPSIHFRFRVSCLRVLNGWVLKAFFSGAVFNYSDNEVCPFNLLYFDDEAHFWLNGYVNKQNCRIWSEANPQAYVETPLHPEKLTVWCALWAGGILLQKR
ncbi:putative transposable element [Trichonephila clavipes]|nr:putative transposable element [Trichonephila clavipes]